jgi:hypothetical protein
MFNRSIYNIKIDFLIDVGPVIRVDISGTGGGNK